MKVALLSNVNVDPINRILTKKNVDLYKSVGYGNELGLMLDPFSPLHQYHPDIVFLLLDLMELIKHNLNSGDAHSGIDDWFVSFESSIKSDYIYYISDGYLYGEELKLVWDLELKNRVEHMWLQRLMQCMEKHTNIRVLPYSRLVQKIGEQNAFSQKMWYMGKIKHSSLLQNEMAEEVAHLIDVESRTNKKVLLLDLDNTLWGGLAGENDITPIVLSDDGVGAIYKDFQRAIKQIKNQGVILGIVSKNNEADAMEIISNHPHMILRDNDFVIKRINWDNKAENILSIAKELNLGTDAIVFVDDNEMEQNLIKDALPEVIVPQFPDRTEDLLEFIVQVYHNYFQKPVVTAEDLHKTEQYQANVEREKAQRDAVDFEGYLKSLEMKMCRVSPENNRERFIQLMNKTNQFNLTTYRYTEKQVNDILTSDSKEVFLYRVSDKFGDNGVVAVAIIEYGEYAVVTDFVMSCRVMGRKIEDAIMQDFEEAARNKNYKCIIGVYKPTAKNIPVKELYSSRGYKLEQKMDDGTEKYKLDLRNEIKREIYVEKLLEENC